MSEPFQLFEGHNRAILPTLPDASLDACVCDPPYELGFMGKKWDSTGIAYDVTLWREVLRVLKPGAHLVAFGGTRTYHRMACAIEDAGFEIRDQLAWCYGSGFPKSMDVAKAIDKATVRDLKTGDLVFGKDTAAVYAVTGFIRAARDAAGKSNAEIDALFGLNGMAGHWTSAASQPQVPQWEQWLQIKALLAASDEMDAEVWRLNGRKGKPGEAFELREVVGEHRSPVPGLGGERFEFTTRAITAPATDAARAWQGWCTALKPAWEPIVLARKPLPGTVAENVITFGTGALNVDASRVPFASSADFEATSGKNQHGEFGSGPTQNEIFGKFEKPRENYNAPGRWPANILHDGADEVVALFPNDGEQSAARFFYSAKADAEDREAGLAEAQIALRSSGELTDRTDGSAGLNSPRAGAGRGSERRNHHPTVKPTALMLWLVRLVTPRGGGSAGLLHGQRQHRPRVRDRRFPVRGHRKGSRLPADRPGPHRRRPRTAVR